MNAWNASAAAATAAASAAAVQPPVVHTASFQYANSVSPKAVVGGAVAVEVGDIVEIQIDGDRTVTGRTRAFTVSSYYDEWERRGCKKHRTEHLYAPERFRETKATLFQHFHPTVSLPGGGTVAVKGDRVVHVVTEAGEVKAETLLLSDPHAVWLGGPNPPGRSPHEKSYIEAEIQSRRNSGHHFKGEPVTQETLKPGKLSVTVTITVRRAK